MKELLFILKNWKLYNHWKSITKGKKPVNETRGAGYYISVGIIGVNPIGKTEIWDMQSGRKAIFELVNYECFSDPSDMIRKSWWHFIGYAEEKPIKDCTFREAIEIYYKKFVK